MTGRGAGQHVPGVRQTYPDLQVRVEQQIAEGEWVATGSRHDAFGFVAGDQATGRVVEITGVNLDRIVGGRIVEHGGAANLLESLMGIGAVRVAGGSRKRGKRGERAGKTGS